MTHSPNSNSFFEEDWWLDAAAGSSWDVVEIEEGGQVVARLPFSVKKKFGLRVISQPQLTQTLGPWLLDTGANYTKRLSREKELYNRLIDGLPKFDVFQQNFHPSITNWLPFYWRGFRETIRYTYVIDLTESDEEILGNFTRQQRAAIKKAAEHVVVQESEDLDVFLDLNEKTFKAQRMAMPYDREYVARLDETLRQRQSRFILIACDIDTGKAHNGIYIAGDSRRMYLLMSGADPRYKGERAGSLLVWHAIQKAKQLGVATFDFEGSMIEPIESFYRGFGATQTPYHWVSKKRPSLQLAEDLFQFPRHRR